MNNSIQETDVQPKARSYKLSGIKSAKRVGVNSRFRRTVTSGKRQTAKAKSLNLHDGIIPDVLGEKECKECSASIIHEPLAQKVEQQDIEPKVESPCAAQVLASSKAPLEVLKASTSAVAEDSVNDQPKKQAEKPKKRKKTVISDGRGYCSEGMVPYSLFRKKAYPIYKEVKGINSLGEFTKYIGPIWKSIPVEERADAHKNIKKYLLC